LDNTKKQSDDALVKFKEINSVDEVIKIKGAYLKVSREIIENYLEEDEFYIGRTEYDSPEIDNEVLIPRDLKSLIIGSFYPAKITSADNFDLYAEIVG